AMFGAIAATGVPRCTSIRCFANVAACAELPRAQVTTSWGGRDLSRMTSSRSGPVGASCCRQTAAGASRNSSAMSMLRLQGEGSGFRPNQVQGARQRIAFRCDEVLPGLRCKPTFELRPQTAEKRETLSSECDQPRCQRIDMARGLLHQLDGDRIPTRRVLDDQRREPAEIAGPCVRM